MKRLTKWEIAVAIENLPGNIAWGSDSLKTVYVDYYTRQELVDRYNYLIEKRNLNYTKIS